MMRVWFAGSVTYTKYLKSKIQYNFGNDCCFDDRFQACNYQFFNDSKIIFFNFTNTQISQRYFGRHIILEVSF